VFNGSLLKILHALVIEYNQLDGWNSKKVLMRDKGQKMKKKDDFSNEDEQMNVDVVTVFKKRNKLNKHFYFFDDERNVWF